MPGTLRHFLKWFIVGASEIKRDMDSNSGVRIVTVHGSKGLEAPVVFLIDTVRTPKDKPEKILSLGTVGQKPDVWIWAPQKSGSEKLEQAADESMNRRLAEYYRLLYVAMTRARDRLYIYGFTSGRKPAEMSWYNQLVNVVQNMPNAQLDEKHIRISDD